jgi:hypothetical protein
MRDFITFMLPIAVCVFLIIYLFLINPDVLAEFGYWLQKFF